MSSDDFAHNPRTLLHIATDLRKRGISPVEIFKRVGVPPSALLNANSWVPRRLCFALGEEAATVTGDGFYGSRIGKTYELAELGVWGRTIIAAADVGKACAIAAKSIGLLHEGTNLRFLTFRQHAQFRLVYRGRLGADPRQHLIGTLAVLRKIALLGNASEAISVRFSMPYSQGADRLEETHGSRLEFGCDHDAIVIDRDVLKMPLQSICEGGPHGPELAETVEGIGLRLKQLLPYGRANIETIAAQERVSIRTVQRRLKAWGFSFEEMLDDLRRTEAMKLVLSEEHSAMEIAFLLGYSNPSHFTRAFRRWTGLPPRNYAQKSKPDSA
jgi:AraC-like DNA-binding protein